MSNATVTEQARRQANLRLLQRTCSADITDIMVSATHVVLYEYRDTAWHKSGIEGSLFVVQRQLSSYELIILNRHSTDNFQMPLTPTFQLQHQEPYLIFKQKQQENEAGRVTGIWFHSADERAMVYSVLQTIQQQAAAAPTPAQVAADAGSAALATLFSPMSINSSSSATTAAVGSTNKDDGSARTLSAPPATSSSTSSNKSSPVAPPGGVALDKKSLQLALLSLIQDDRFLDLLHSQYLRVVHARSKRQQGGNSSEGTSRQTSL